MAANTAIQQNTPGSPSSIMRFLTKWQTPLYMFLILACVIVALWMRLHDLAVPFDRDGYDEGVYWQSLRAMSTGQPLYQQIFYSQPPFFLLSIFPAYLVLGKTLWAARFGVVLLSLFGLAGAFLLGKALGGRVGAIVALLLLVADPLYLAESVTLQAEAPATALMLLSVALAYLWWEQLESRRGSICAVLSAMTLSLSICSKLFGVVAVIPIGLLVLERLRHIVQEPAGTRLSKSRSLLLGSVSFFLTTAIVVLPFVGSFHQFVQGTVTFHTAASRAFQYTQGNNLSIIKGALLSLLTLAACYGTIVALLRHDWRVIPLIFWLLATCIILWRQVPLFPHHLVILAPPLLGLAAIGCQPIGFDKLQASFILKLSTGIALLLILATVFWNVRAERAYLRNEHGRITARDTQQTLRIASDLQHTIAPTTFVITDAQFLAGQADRTTPPDLVDTSQVRIQSGYLDAQQLIHAASQPEVGAILFDTGRLSAPQLAPFHSWVAQHFRLFHRYGSGKELWVRL